MIQLASIRKDLKSIRYYYSRKEVFDAVNGEVHQNTIMEKVRLYNFLIAGATPQLYDVYVSLYVKSLTQEGLAEELGFTPEYIQKLNKRLLKYLQKRLTEEQEKKEEKSCAN